MAQVGRSTIDFNAFNGGEWSRYLYDRFDQAKYTRACTTLQNAIPMAYGPASKRKGFEYIAPAKFANKKTWLVGFEYSVTTALIIEVGDQYMRFFANGAQVEKTSADAWVTTTAYEVGDYVEESSTIYYCIEDHTSGVFATDLAADKWVAQTIYEIPTPYLEADTRQLQFEQLNDVVFITHPDYEVRTLTRLANDNWTLATVSWDVPPLLDENLTTTTITPSATTGSVTLTASSSIFQSGHVGSTWRIAHLYPSLTTELSLAVGAATSAAFLASGVITFRTTGTWTGDVWLERQDSAGSWAAVKEFKGNADINYNDSFDQGDEGANFRLRKNIGSVTGSPYAYVTRPTGVFNGYARITAVASGTSATATITKALFSTGATSVWSEAAFSGVRGYPRTATFYEQRLIFGGTNHQPLTVWGSEKGEIYNFGLGAANDDDGFTYTLSGQQNAIQWLLSQDVVMIGTIGGEYILRSGSDSSTLSPTSVQIVKQSAIGSSYHKALIVGNSAFYRQRNEKKLHALTYTFEADAFRSSEATMLSEHITDAGITQHAYQQHPYQNYLAVTEDGNLINMIVDTDNEIQAWARNNTNGEFKSVAKIYGDSDDEVWAVIEREINGETVQYIERQSGVYNARTAKNDIDLMIVLDLSTSMTETLDNLRAWINKLFSSINIFAGNLRIGLTTFGQTASSGAPTLELDFTNNQDVFKAALASLSTGGYLEPGLDAIELAADTANWSADTDVNKYMLLITDEDEDAGSSSYASALADLNANDITLLHTYTFDNYGTDDATEIKVTAAELSLTTADKPDDDFRLIVGSNIVNPKRNIGDYTSAYVWSLTGMNVTPLITNWTVDVFDGWQSILQDAPWSLEFTYSDASTKTVTGGSTTTAASDPSIQTEAELNLTSSEYYDSGPFGEFYIPSTDGSGAVPASDNAAIPTTPSTNYDDLMNATGGNFIDINSNESAFIGDLISRFQSDIAIVSEELTTAIFLDCSMLYNSTPTTTITGLGHLEGETVAVLADGSYVGTKKVQSGEITLDTAASLVNVGFPYAMIVEPLQLIVDITAGGVSLTQSKSVHEVFVGLVSTLGGKIWNGEVFREIPYRKTGDTMDTATPFFTGQKSVTIPPVTSRTPELKFVHDEPYPCTLRSMSVKYRIHEQ